MWSDLPEINPSEMKGKMKMWTWKKESLKFFGGLFIVLAFMYLWTHPYQSSVPVIQAQPSQVKSQIQQSIQTKVISVSPTDWNKCFDVFITPNIKEKGYMTIISNKCTIAMDSFNANFKLYDVNDARVGWDTNKIGVLEPHEKVKFWMNFPLKDYPLTKDAVKIQLYEYSKGE